MISKRFIFLALSLIMITKHFKSCNCVSQLVSIYIRAERLIEWGCKLENYILRHLISLLNDSRHYSCLLYFTRSRKRCTNALPYVSLTARTETSLPAILSVWRTSSNTCFLYLSGSLSHLCYCVQFMRPTLSECPCFSTGCCIKEI